jgi:serine/threonine protein kinase/Tfp pilus assembly protein PilF
MDHKTIGQYEVVRLIGEGGMGRVFLARDPMLDRHVAVKVLSSSAPLGEEVARFEREAKALAALDHPNILSIHEFGRIGSTPYVVMELLEGGNLRDLIATGPMAHRNVIRYSIEIAHGLAAAHEKGITHRDLKPENIFITRGDHVKIVDFGLANVRIHQHAPAESSGKTILTAPGAVIGTVGYMAPEQVRGEVADHRADLFTFGAVMFEMLTGKRPFEESSMVETLHAILKSEPPMRRLEDVRVPRPLIEIIGRCLEKNVTRRFQSAQEIVSALQSIPSQSEWVSTPRTFRTSSTSSGTAVGRRTSIAVLPFKNIGGDADMEYFSDGVTEDIINALTQVDGLYVAARTSCFAFKGKSAAIPEIGAALRVNTVLEGSVRRFGKRLRITTQLIDVGDGYHLWSERYDRELDDIFAIQDDIAINIAQKLRLALADREDDEPLVKPATRNLDAYELYLKARFLVEQRGEGLVKGLEYFRQAIAADPDYALAYAGMAETLSLLAVYGVADARTVMPGAKGAAHKALQLDDGLAEAHNAMALVSVLHDWGWTRAMTEFDRALKINPNFVPAHYWKGLFCNLFVKRRAEDALRETQRAVDLDPMAALPAYALGLVYIGTGRYEDAVHLAERMLARDPSQAILYRPLGVARLCLEQYDEATIALERGAALSLRHPWFVGELGVVRVAKGEPGEARRLQEELLARSHTTYISPMALSVIPIALGELDTGMRYMEMAFEQRDPLLIAATTWPMLAPVRNEPRVVRLFEEMGVL